MALLTEKWPAHTATCSKEHLEAKHGHIRDAVKRSSSQWPTGIKSPPYRMTPRGRRQYAAVFVWWEQWRVRLFLRAVCICYRVTFSRGPSAWHVTWWLKNQSNMNACGRGMKNDLTCCSWRLNELICLLLPFKNKKKKNDPLWLIHSPEMLLGKVLLWKWKQSRCHWSLSERRYLVNPISVLVMIDLDNGNDHSGVLHSQSNRWEEEALKRLNNKVQKEQLFSRQCTLQVHSDNLDLY